MLTENGIIEYVNKLKSKNMYLDELRLKYKPDLEQPFVKIDSLGMEDVYSDDEYYENIHENLIAANLGWLQSVAHKIRMPMEATVGIDQSGNFVTDQIEMTLTINAPKSLKSVVPFLYPRFKSLVLINEFVDTIQVRGYNGVLQFIRINLKIDSNRIISLLNRDQVNRTILNNWVGAVNNYVKENVDTRDIYEQRFQVVNGKINLKYKMEFVTQYFALAKDN